MAGSTGDSAQIRMIAEQVGESAAEIAISKFVSQHPELRQGTVTTEIPAPLRWAAIVASAILTISASGGFIWLVSTVNDMQVTLARMDERMASFGAVQEGRMTEVERRVEHLEAYHRTGGL